ncbi:hypothetical protein, partial [Halorubellus sp. PRR65]|uniref:hypothetical protein n=1 Tax=Halorubellus sp. PRR65 TaxID=3098148 RepID=UPI002B258E81
RHVLQTVVAEQSGIPSSFYYSFSRKENGLKYHSFSLQSVVSDIRNLYYVLQKQTAWYEQQQSQQESAQQTDKSAW